MECEHGQRNWCRECEAKEAELRGAFHVDPIKTEGFSMALLVHRKFKLSELFWEWLQNGGDAAYCRGIQAAQDLFKSVCARAEPAGTSGPAVRDDVRCDLPEGYWIGLGSEGEHARGPAIWTLYRTDAVAASDGMVILAMFFERENATKQDAIDAAWTDWSMRYPR